MDFSVLTNALASNSFDQVADICDDLMVQVASQGIAFQEEWPNSARFLWKSMPSVIKENNPEGLAAWKFGQRLWTRDYAGVYDAIRGFDWSQQVQDLVAAFSERYTQKMFELLLSAYSTISIYDAALFLGMNEDVVTNYVLEHGWSVDPASRMLTEEANYSF